MDSEKFVSIIREVVRNIAIEDTMDNIKDPPGRKVPESELIRSNWFNALSDIDQDTVKSIVEDAVDEAIFGILSVLDGTRAIEEGDDKGTLVLVHEDKSKVVLNDPDAIGLHDLYNAAE
tara:strand:- start:290 stop:646 length:357 start_codon:yes stop_codon:yes gene_type:complete